MVELKVKLGPKGQILIPKILRDHYKIFPNHEAIIVEREEGILIKKEDTNLVEKLRSIAEKINKHKKRKLPNAKHIKEIFYEQYKERARRSGINTK